MTDYRELAQYNAECARGIVHTPEWDARMTEKQREFDEKYDPTPQWQHDNEEGVAAEIHADDD